ncbi:hypothetical protein [Duganella hordei]|uniref:hypothetical protein n=1 Tax=Duganella hordei TaxID=2865934 RepID=UPI0030E8FC34
MAIHKLQAKAENSLLSEQGALRQRNLPSADFIVSKNKDGTALSHYGDDSWDRTAYDSDGVRSIFSFKFWKIGEITEQRSQLMEAVKWIMYLLIFERGGTQLSNGSLKNYMKPLKAMARFCDAKNLRIDNVFFNHQIMLAFLVEQDQMAKLAAALVNFLGRLGPNIVGYEVANKKTLVQLQQRASDWAGRGKQHPPIPTRIYSEILSIIDREIDAFQKMESKLFPLLEACLTNPLIGRAASNQWKKRSSDGRRSAVLPTFKQLLQEYDLELFWDERGYSWDIRGLSVSVLEMSIAASLQIQAYTGMRANEVAALPYDCFEETAHTDGGSTHFIINGRIRKISGGKSKLVRWVTSDSGRTAIRLAQRLATILFRARNSAADSSDTRTVPSHLFSSAGLFGTKKTGNIADLKIYRFKSLDEWLPIIAEEDLFELEQIDPHRAWRFEEKFTLGQRWPFSSHQLRRSLALYAQRSGLVSLPTLKRQLHHVTAEMSAYYGRGSAFAKQFIQNEDGKKHFGFEWQDAQPVSQYLSYAINVLLLSDSDLFGVHPQWMKHRLTDGEGVVRFDRATTLARFKKGELAYKETLLGGCVKVGECNRNPLDLLHVECITTHCKNMVGHKKKLERVVTAQSRLVDRLAIEDNTSPEFRHENANLFTLQCTLRSLSKLKN